MALLKGSEHGSLFPHGQAIMRTSACDRYVRKSRILLSVRRFKRPFKSFLNGGRGGATACVHACALCLRLKALKPPKIAVFQLVAPLRAFVARVVAGVDLLSTEKMTFQAGEKPPSACPA